MKRRIVPFIQTQRQKQFLTTQTLIMRLNQFIVQLWQDTKISCLGWTIDSVIEQNINIWKYKPSSGSS